MSPAYCHMPVIVLKYSGKGRGFMRGTDTGGNFMNIWHDVAPGRIKKEDFVAYI